MLKIHFVAILKEGGQLSCLLMPWLTSIQRKGCWNRTPAHPLSLPSSKTRIYFGSKKTKSVPMLLCLFYTQHHLDSLARCCDCPARRWVNRSLPAFLHYNCTDQIRKWHFVFIFISVTSWSPPTMAAQYETRKIAAPDSEGAWAWHNSIPLFCLLEHQQHCI